MKKCKLFLSLLAMTTLPTSFLSSCKKAPVEQYEYFLSDGTTDFGDIVQGQTVRDKDTKTRKDKPWVVVHKVTYRHCSDAILSYEGEGLPEGSINFSNNVVIIGTSMLQIRKYSFTIIATLNGQKIAESEKIHFNVVKSLVKYHLDGGSTEIKNSIGQQIHDDKQWLIKNEAGQPISSQDISVAAISPELNQRLFINNGYVIIDALSGLSEGQYKFNVIAKVNDIEVDTKTVTLIANKITYLLKGGTEIFDDIIDKSIKVDTDKPWHLEDNLGHIISENVEMFIEADDKKIEAAVKLLDTNIIQIDCKNNEMDTGSYKFNLFAKLDGKILQETKKIIQFTIIPRKTYTVSDGTFEIGKIHKGDAFEDDKFWCVKDNNKIVVDVLEFKIYYENKELADIVTITKKSDDEPNYAKVKVENVVDLPIGDYKFWVQAKIRNQEQQEEVIVTQNPVTFTVVEAQPTLEDLEFISHGEDGYGVKVKQDKKKSVEKISIPEEYNGEPVTILEDNAFADCAKLKQMFIPDNITTIGKNALKGCSNLNGWFTFREIVEVQDFALCFSESSGGNITRLVFGPNLDTIGKSAIGSTALKSITFMSISIPQAPQSGYLIANAPNLESIFVRKELIEDFKKIVGEKFQDKVKELV